MKKREVKCEAFELPVFAMNQFQFGNIYSVPDHNIGVYNLALRSTADKSEFDLIDLMQLNSIRSDLDKNY